MDPEDEIFVWDLPDDDEPLDLLFSGHTPPAAAPRRTEPATAEEIIAEMVSHIVERFAPLQIILFGSRARGTARPRSDVDLLIVFTEVRDKRALAIAIGDYLYAAALPKDILVSTPEDLAYEQQFTGSVLERALREGIVLYDSRSPHAHDARLATLRARRS